MFYKYCFYNKKKLHKTQDYFSSSVENRLKWGGNGGKKIKKGKRNYRNQENYYWKRKKKTVERINRTW